MVTQGKALPHPNKCPTPDHILLMNIIVWNYRGALDPNFSSSIVELVNDHSPVILTVTDTHVDGDIAKEIIDRLPFSGAIHADTIGYTGGIWLLWNSNAVEVS